MFGLPEVAGLFGLVLFGLPIIVWFVLSFVVSEYARGKGLSPGFYLITSFLFSPALMLVIALIADVNENELIKKGYVIRCDQCWELIRPEALICKHCKNEVPITLEDQL